MEAFKSYFGKKHRYDQIPHIYAAVLIPYRHCAALVFKAHTHKIQLTDTVLLHAAAPFRTVIRTKVG